MMTPSHGMLPDPKHPHMQNLVAWYPMFEGGLTAYDVSGNGLHGTYGGGIGSPAVNQLTNPISIGREFVDDGDGLLTGVPATLEYTLSIWIMRSGWPSGLQRIASLNHPTDAFRRYDLGSAIGGLVGNSFEHTAADFGWLKITHQQAFRWYHICFVRRGNNITGKGYTLYVDGEEFNSRNSGGFNIGGTLNWSIGATWTGAWSANTKWQSTNGLANARFYDRAIDQEQMVEMTLNPWAPFMLRPEKMPFPFTGLTAVRWGPVGRGRVRSAQDLGTHRIGGAP